VDSQEHVHQVLFLFVVVVGGGGFATLSWMTVSMNAIISTWSRFIRLGARLASNASRDDGYRSGRLGLEKSLSASFSSRKNVARSWKAGTSCR
jgi:hypothetical protein